MANFLKSGVFYVLCKILVFYLVLLSFPKLSSARSGNLIGGWTPKDVDHPSVKDVAKYAADDINRRSNDMHYVRVLHIHDAQTQLVSGLKYNVTFDIGKTVCRKNEGDSNMLESCAIDQNTMVKRCEVTIWDKPWMKEESKKLLHSECSEYLSYPKYLNAKLA